MVERGTRNHDCGGAYRTAAATVTVAIEALEHLRGTFFFELRMHRYNKCVCIYIYIYVNQYRKFGESDLGTGRYLHENVGPSWRRIRVKAGETSARDTE